MVARRARASGPGGLRWSEIERALQAAHGPLLAAIDEVGRGPLAGPVVVCALVMPPDVAEIDGVNDSKKLAPAVRERVAAEVRAAAVALALGAASPREIDTLNVYHATVLAMRRALAGLSRQLAAGGLGPGPDHVLVDGKPLRSLGVPHTAVVGGDARCYAVGCASVVAKVTRDRLMRALARRHDAYAWDRNVGYPTPAHRTALATLGATPHHRRSFTATVAVPNVRQAPTTA